MHLTRPKMVVVGLVAIALALAGCSRETPSDTVTLTFADGFSATHPIGKGGAQPFLTYLQEHGPSVGLEIDYFAAGQLGTAKDALHLLRSGAVDLAPVIPAYLANELPMSSVGELPGLVENTCAATGALMPMVRPGGILYEQEIERQEALPLWGIAIPGYEIFTSDRRIARPADLGGMLIRSFGGVGDRVVAGLGAAPVQISGPDLYEAVARKTVAGALLTTISVAPYGLEDVLGYSTSGANLSSTTVLYSTSQQAWEELDSEQRNVLMEASRVAQQSGCDTLTKVSKEAMDDMAAGGIEITEVAENEQAWDDALEPVRERWVDDLTSVGMPAGDVLDEFQRRLDGENR
ncbi:TRAP transporter substrate-binding protein DctP [Gordonia sp. PKS22-38]|uniref:TRAP transporter substrate-binding protein DctP n=1 Tax=Gordonia prachuapensis TaxID=3115651 RepID=A0ABU7MUM9_9ACTN|nr:TRAP transporter substrate-binding protein DctP [Gordonia sp. PKS22-38]